MTNHRKQDSLSRQSADSVVLIDQEEVRRNSGSQKLDPMDSDETKSIEDSKKLDEKTPLPPIKGADCSLPQKEREESGNRREEKEFLLELKKETVNTFLEIKCDLLGQYVEFRNQIFKGQKFVRMVSQIATLNLLLMGIVNCLYGFISFSPLSIFISFYIMVISAVILMLELSRSKQIINLKSFIRTWSRFLDLSAGRGLTQVLLSTISLSLTQSPYFSLMSLFVGGTGLLNIAFGLLAASKLKKIVNILRYYGTKDMEEIGVHRGTLIINQSDLGNVSINKDQDPEYILRKIHRLFETLDEDGNGQIDQNELFKGITSLNLPFEISLSEIEVIFEHLDKDNNKVISVQEFEDWFISNKCPYFIL
ncbi:EF hand domain-containing protein [Cryptosporidium felis]|nr:EF hand domain-containing protein [Cryptosporidium felis]